MIALQTRGRRSSFTPTETRIGGIVSVIINAGYENEPCIESVSFLIGFAQHRGFDQLATFQAAEQVIKNRHNKVGEQGMNQNAQ